jgi:carbonic anhydrase
MATNDCDWDYGLQHGPAHWGEECNVLCDNGLLQSPINIESSSECNVVHEDLNIIFDSPAMIMKYIQSSNDEPQTYKLSVGDTGTSQEFTVKDNTYKLAQFHLHTPAEHTINGKQFAGAIHFVHVNNDSSATIPYAVIAVGLDYGTETQATLRDIVENIKEDGTVNNEQITVKIQDLIPSALDAYTYLGSFTTPPCTEGVQFVISDKALPITQDDFTKLSKLKGTVRATQNLNSREVVCASSTSNLLMSSISAFVFLALI